MDTQTVTIKTGYIKSQIKNGRVEAGGRLHLDVSRIRRILAYGGNYYIEYITDKVDYYKQHIEAPPPLAVELKYSIKEYKVDVCDVCGSEIEWDADEPFCPRGCDEKYDDWSYHTETRQRFVVESSVADEVKQFIEKAFGVKAEFVDSLYRNIAGGYTPQFQFADVDLTLHNAYITGLSAVENPAFVYTDYDSIEAIERRYDGKFIAVRTRSSGGYETLLFKYQGEPNLSLAQKLHEDHERAEEEQKERQKRLEEEEERRRKEEEDKWGDPAKVAEAIRAALPDWADGAVVVAKSVCGEDCDVYYYVYPIKRSQRGGGFYYSSEWRTLKVGVPDRFLEKLVDHVVLRDGRTVKVRQEKNGGKYVTLKTA
jgi:hypothetical protein